MRSDLTAVEGVSDVVTDVDEKTVTFVVDDELDIETILDELTQSNNKLKDWQFIK